MSEDGRGGGEGLRVSVCVREREGEREREREREGETVTENVVLTLAFFSARDQRITQDVDRFCDQTSKVLPKIILQPFLIAYYTYRTFEG